MSGWKNLEEIMDIPRISEFLIVTILSRVKDANIYIENLWIVEPLIVVLLRFCYWYYQILSMPSIKYKQKEIRQRLGRRLLNNLKKIALETFSIDDYNTEEEIKKEIDANLNKMNNFEIKDVKKLSKHYIEYYNFFDVCLSEILYAALSKNLGHKTEFKPRNRDFDFDIVICDVPVQVKNSFGFEIFGIDEKEHKN